MGCGPGAFRCEASDRHPFGVTDRDAANDHREHAYTGQTGLGGRPTRSRGPAQVVGELALADRVVNNDGTIADLHERTRRALAGVLDPDPRSGQKLPRRGHLGAGGAGRRR